MTEKGGGHARGRRRWDVVITRPIHHAVPAGMRWGQSRTTQLQPVLVCYAQLHCVPTMFCCLLLDFLSPSSLVFPFARFHLCSALNSSVHWQISHLFLSPSAAFFELAAQAITKRSAAVL